MKDLWKNKHDAILQQGNQLLAALQTNSVTAKGEVLTEEILEEAFQEFSARYDRQSGGFGKAPKFPSPHQLLFLLRYWKRTGNDQALMMVEKTLKVFSNKLRQILQMKKEFQRKKVSSYWFDKKKCMMVPYHPVIP